MVSFNWNSNSVFVRHANGCVSTRTHIHPSQYFISLSKSLAYIVAQATTVNNRKRFVVLISFWHWLFFTSSGTIIFSVCVTLNHPSVLALVVVLFLQNITKNVIQILFSSFVHSILNYNSYWWLIKLSFVPLFYSEDIHNNLLISTQYFSHSNLSVCVKSFLWWKKMCLQSIMLLIHSVDYCISVFHTHLRKITIL